MRRTRARPGAVIAMALCAALAASLTTADAEIVLRQRYPVEGTETQVFVNNDDGLPISGATVAITYRPGSSVEVTEEIGTTGPGGRLTWTPAKAGIASIHATWDGGETSTNVSVKFATIPGGGMIIMVLAGLLLVGGSVVRIMRVLKSSD